MHKAKILFITDKLFNCNNQLGGINGY